MKLRVLTYTNKGKWLALADLLAEKGGSEYKADSIPPDYPCDKERLAVIIASVGGKFSGDFERFCKDLGRARAQRVALIVDGTPEKAAPMIEWIKSAGANLYEDTLYVSGGAPFKFIKGVTEEEKNTAFAWFDKVLAWLNA